MSQLTVVSMSGGKDSTACAILACRDVDAMHRAFVFADTGNEHELVYEYLDYLQRALGITIVHLKQDFSDWWWRRRDYVRDKWAGKGVPDDVITRTLAVFDAGPTGNPYLDLCIIKHRFPARKAQFCTQYLKSEPLTEYHLELIDQGFTVESWQGVRADESANRAHLPERDDRGGGLTIYRPILRWNVQQVFALHAEHGIDPNPLYKLGLTRVGCMPCINANKQEIAAIAARFPEHIDRIEEWERLVCAANKSGAASFFPDPDDQAHMNKRGIRNMVAWSKTSRGGKQYHFDSDAEPSACASAYGLCE